jgi:hypothetical protein
MWERKSDEELARARSRLWLSFCGPLLWFLVLFVSAIVLAFEGPRGPVQRWPQTWPQIFSFSVRGAAIGALVVYVLQLVAQRKIDPFRTNRKVVICETCHRVQYPNSEGKCECGGKLDDFDNWTWIEE